MSKAARDAAAAAIYIALSVYLFSPHFEKFNSLRYLIPANCFIGAFGCYLLSKRWIAGFAGSFFSGCVYGFGPYLISFAKFHPAGGFLVAVIPWLFLPAAFSTKAKLKWLQAPLSLIPFLAIVLFFQAAARLGFFPIPVQINIARDELIGLISPMAMAQKSNILLGFYHVPMGALIIGLSMLFAARRYGIIMIIAAGIILAFFGAFLAVSPIIWLAIPIACLSVVIGQGAEGLINSGFSDRKWILAVAVILLGLAIACLLFGTKCAYIFAGLGLKYTTFFTESAKMYLLGAVMLFIIFFLACMKLRILGLRVVLVCSAIAADLFLSARFIVDSIL